MKLRQKSPLIHPVGGLFAKHKVKGPIAMHPQNNNAQPALKTVVIKIETQLSPDGPAFTKTFSRAFADAENLPGILESPLRSSLTDLISHLI